MCIACHDYRFQVRRSPDGRSPWAKSEGTQLQVSENAAFLPWEGEAQHILQGTVLVNKNAKMSPFTSLRGKHVILGGTSAQVAPNALVRHKCSFLRETCASL